MKSVWHVKGGEKNNRDSKSEMKISMKEYSSCLFSTSKEEE